MSDFTLNPFSEIQKLESELLHLIGDKTPESQCIEVTPRAKSVDEILAFSKVYNCRNSNSIGDLDIILN